MKRFIGFITAALVMGFAGSASAVVITGLTPGDFAAPTIEDFPGPQVIVNTLDFGNGMVYSSLVGESDLIGRTFGYGLGLESSILAGKDGAGDGYFGTNETPTTFEFAFAGGITKFGFFGAESRVDNESDGQNGELDIEFYDLSDVLIEALAVSTAGTFAWDQFHGFSHAPGIGRVVFVGVGAMVLDDIHFENSDGGGRIPEPASLAIFGFGLLGLGLAKRRRKTA